jgi:hypothetical protein
MDLFGEFGLGQGAEVGVVIPGVVADFVAAFGPATDFGPVARFLEVASYHVDRVAEIELIGELFEAVHDGSEGRILVPGGVAEGMVHGIQVQTDGGVTHPYWELSAYDSSNIR